MIFIHLFSEPWVAYMSPLPRCALSESSCGFNHPKPCTNNLFLLASATIPILLQILKCASLGTSSFYFLTSIFSHKFPLQFLEPLVNTSSIPFRVQQMLYTSLLTKTLDILSLLKLSLSPKAYHPLLQQLTLLYVQTIYSPHLSFTQCLSSPSTITLFCQKAPLSLLNPDYIKMNASTLWYIKFPFDNLSFLGNVQE